MSENRESDLLACILGVLIMAISGIAVGLASSGSVTPNKPAVTTDTERPPAAIRSPNR
jgi:hypothetical protein